MLLSPRAAVTLKYKIKLYNKLKFVILYPILLIDTHKLTQQIVVTSVLITITNITTLQMLKGCKQTRTSVQIIFRSITKTRENRTLTIRGPLLPFCP